jgi:AcrR family transcriptional regulator
VDGRAARGERTRRAIVDAHISLIRAGELTPTGAQIADRAGVSLRSLWGNFNDIETLFAATGAEVLDRQNAMLVPIDADLPLDERLEAYCRQRAEILEFIAPFARSSEIRAPFSRELQRNRVRYLHSVRVEAEALFASELARLDDAGRREVVQALGIIVTWPTWVSLRDVMRLPIPEATAVMTRMIAALLTTD